MNFKVTHKKAVLNVLAVNLNSKIKSIDFIKPLVEKVASPLVAELPTGEYALYIRDLKEYSIDNKYPGGHTYNPFESMVALPSWNFNHADIEAVVAHELHHLARWHHAGYGLNLGEAVVSEGLASLYEEEISNIKPAWAKAKVNKKSLEKLIKDWNDKNYNHAEWFFDGKSGRWFGYSVGYRIAKQIYPNGINLKDSLIRKVTPKDIDINKLI